VDLRGCDLPIQNPARWQSTEWTNPARKERGEGCSSGIAHPASLLKDQSDNNFVTVPLQRPILLVLRRRHYLFIGYEYQR
jgi:hypothetical protein